MRSVVRRWDFCQFFTLISEKALFLSQSYYKCRMITHQPQKQSPRNQQMKMNYSTQKAGGLLAALLMAAGTATSMAAHTPKIQERPLTHQEIADYALPAGTQPSGGLHTVGLGQPVYLEALMDIAVINITNVAWAITTQPIGATDVLEASPLGVGVPIYELKDREFYQLAGRSMLRPKVEGSYTVTATVTANSVVTVLTLDVTAATYVGVNTCATCHDGKAAQCALTGHATFFTEAIDGIKSSHYNSGCIQCHVVGYDTNPLAVNGGFDDVATAKGWTFPTTLQAGNWAAMPAELKNVSNIQCENCHGAGSQHAAMALIDETAAKKLIHVNYKSGNCAQCHTEEPYHVFPLQWENSKHAVAVEETSTGCVGCHQGLGFIDRTNGVAQSSRRTAYEPINCATCHESHDATNPHQVRTVADMTLMDTSKPGGATVVTEGGNGKLCMQCHISRRDAVSYCETTAGSDRFGPHHGPQTDMLVGANAITYGKAIPSSAHNEVISDSCVTCHMQATANTSAEHLHAGGHTWNMAWDDGPSGRVELVAACVVCHGDTEGFDFKRKDYDGNGVIDGVQTEVKGLLSKLAIMLPPVGVPKPNHSPTNIAINATWTKPQLKAGYNYLFVVEDGSYGIHNLSYAVGLLKASIADLNGDANSDGIADSWQLQYFGADWANNPDAARNASPAGDGMPNWLKFSLNLDPHVAGVVVPDGVVWTSGNSIGGNEGEILDTIHIYTAAEVAFPTVVGKTYQIQATSELSGGWQNIGVPIPGTGNVFSYLTPTRNKVKNFFRVAITTP